MARRIGLTTRVVKAAHYAEWRDALAHDWVNFMAKVLPEVQWMLIPNLGGEVVAYVEAWGLDGFILTGGNDLGEYANRDETEERLLHYAMTNQLPVLGVCRGLQVIQKFFGGKISKCPRNKHVAVSHLAHIVNPLFYNEPDVKCREVNSYHNYAVMDKDLATPLRSFAVTDDGLAEGIYHPEAAMVAVQWHPERFKPFAKSDQVLIRRVFAIEP